jgi:hypothetical protein
MDASSVGAGNSALYLQRAAAGLQAPLTAIKQEEMAAQAIAQVLTQGGQSAQQAAAVADSAVKSGSIGTIVDISV